MDIDQLISFAERIADAGSTAAAKVSALNEAHRLSNYLDFTARDILRVVPPTDEIAERVSQIQSAMREARSLTQAAIPDIEMELGDAQKVPGTILDEAASAGISGDLLAAAAAIVADSVPSVQNRVRISDLLSTWPDPSA